MPAGTPSTAGTHRRGGLNRFFGFRLLHFTGAQSYNEGDFYCKEKILHFFYIVSFDKPSLKSSPCPTGLTERGGLETLAPWSLGGSVENSGLCRPTIENLGICCPRCTRPTAAVWAIALVFCFAAHVPDLAAREKDAVQYGAGLIVNVPFAEAEVVQVVQEVVQNGIIRGSKEYNKDEFVSGAEAAESTRVFPAWTEGGKVFYKVRLHALDPRNFKDSGDVGTLAVRYVIQAQGGNHTVLRIDARFVEDFRHVAHPSNGSVESAECKDIHDRLDSLALMKSEASDAEQKKLESSSRKQSPELNDESAASALQPTPSAQASQPPPNPPEFVEPVVPVSLEQRVHDLKQQVQRIVKAPGAPLKSAPFHTASTLQALPSGTEVLIVISTPYWYGVETHDGQHGWMLRDELEMLP